MDETVKQFKYVGTEPLLFEAGGKEHHLATGKKAKLPASDAYVAGLVASGLLVEVAGQPDTNAPDIVRTAPAPVAAASPSETPAETAPAGAAKSSKNKPA